MDHVRQFASQSCLANPGQGVRATIALWANAIVIVIAALLYSHFVHPGVCRILIKLLLQLQQKHTVQRKHNFAGWTPRLNKQLRIAQI